ncbi:MAG TPA: amidohydrolase family protein [Gemmatimonadaceae bacterium]|nr:amidohydrolase family protein [Gemmatimonadaceae bacterium]
MSIRRSSLLASLILAAPSPAPQNRALEPVPAAASAAAPAIVDSLRIFYIGRPAGWERYELKAGDGGMTLTSDYDYVDRGRRNHTQLTMKVANDYAVRTFEMLRITDTSRTVTTSVELDGGRAKFMRNGKSSEVAIPAVAYAVSSYAPTAQHLALIRYWESHGRPTTIAIVPGDPNPVAIRKRGIDTVGKGANRVRLTRYTIDGVIWGINFVWLDSDGRLAMFATGGGGGLSFKTVRAALLPLRDELMDVATRAQMAELLAITARAKPVAEGSLAFVGATLVDATGAPAIPDATVIVERGRIVAAGPNASTPVPPGARRIDVAGKTIIPGLWDNHAHLHQIEWIPTYIAAGVTSVRDMGSEWPLLVAMRSAIRSGKVTGSNLFFAGLVDGPGPQGFGEFSAATPEEGRAIVRRYHQLGFEMIKIYLALAPDVTAAICHEAHRNGMTCTGHVPTSMDLHAAIDSGMDQLAHFPVRGDLTSDSGKVQLAHFLAKKTIFDPTASWGEIGGKSAQEPMENIQPVLEHLPATMLQNRIASLGQSPSDTATSHARLARTLANIKAAHDAGVPIITGTDEGIPAYSVYREMELYVKAGFTPMEALRSATAVSAQAMRVDKDVGTIEKGKRADLLVLDANPLDNISNVRNVRFVIKDGRMFESAALWTAAGFRP